MMTLLVMKWMITGMDHSQNSRRLAQEKVIFGPPKRMNRSNMIQYDPILNGLNAGSFGVSEEDFLSMLGQFSVHIQWLAILASLFKIEYGEPGATVRRVSQ